MNPEIKQLRKDNRRLERFITKQQERLNWSEEVNKRLRIRFYDYFIKDIIGILTPREQKILEMRWGFIDGIPHILDKIAMEFGVHRERVRQIEGKAILKLIFSPNRKEIRKEMKKNKELIETIKKEQTKLMEIHRNKYK